MKQKLQMLIYDAVEMKCVFMIFFAETGFVTGYANGYQDKAFP